MKPVKRNLTFDADGVIFNIINPMLEVINQHCETNFTYGQWNHYNVKDIPQMAEVIEYKDLTAMLEAFTAQEMGNSLAHPYLSGFMFKLSKEYNLKILTAKSEKMLTWTRQVLKWGNLDWIPVEVCPMDHPDKWDEKYVWDLLIEDRWDTVRMCLQRNRPAILFAQPWNIQSWLTDNFVDNNYQSNYPITWSWPELTQFLLRKDLWTGKDGSINLEYFHYLGRSADV